MVLPSFQRAFGRLASGLQLRATPENPRYSLNDPNLWEMIFGGARDNDAGVPVNHAKALSFPPVFQAVTMIAGDIATLPLDAYQRVGKKDRESADNHVAYNLVRRQANDEQTAVVFWELLMCYALLWGKGYAMIDQDGAGNPLGLYPLLPDRTGPERHNGQLVYVSEIDGKLKVFFPHEVLAIERPKILSQVPCDLVDASREQIAAGLAAHKFAARFFKHGGRKGGILELPAAVNKSRRDELEAGFRKTYEGAENPFKTVVLREGAKFHEAQASLADSQMIEARQESVRDVARYFNLAPSRLGVEDGTSYASKEEDRQSYLDRTLGVWLAKICAECWAKLLSPAERRRDSHYFEHNTNALLRTNTTARYQAYAIGIRNRFLTPNDARRAENLEPLEGGDEVLVAPGMGQQSQLNSEQAGAGNADDGSSGNKDPDTQDTGGPPPDESSRQHRRRRWTYNLGARARHKSRNAKAYLEWVDGGLASHRQELAELLPEADAAEILRPILAALRTAAETHTAADLAAAVDDLMTFYEINA